MRNISRCIAALINCVLLVCLGIPVMAQQVPQDGHQTRMVMKDRTPISHMEITIKGEKRRIPVFNPLKSSKLTILQANTEPGFKEQKPGRFDSFDLLSASALEGSNSTFVNRDYLTNSTPYINAKHFENYGEFDVESPDRMPFYFYNTQSFTNKGNIYIDGNIDFQTYNTKENLFGEFDYDPVMATNFVNERTGVVENRAEIGGFNFIRIHARDIINRGLISAAGSMIIDLKGENVDLTGGALEMKAGASYDYYEGPSGIGPSFGFSGYNGQRAYTVLGDVTAGYHLPTWGVSDIYWCEYRSGSMGWYTVGDLVGVLSPLHSWTEMRGTYSIVSGPGLESRPNGTYINWIGGWGFNGRAEAVFTPYVDERVVLYPTINDVHYVTQMAFVRNRYPDLFEIDAKIWPLSADRNQSFEPEIFHDSKVVEIKTKKGLTNNITGGTQLESFYVIDELANVEASWNGMLTNWNGVLGSPVTMPDSLVLSRFRPAEYSQGSGFNSAWPPSLISEASYSMMTTHGARISNIVSRSFISDLPNIDVPGSSKANQPGSIFVVATNSLNLANARIRGEGGIYLETKHLVSTENVSLDCQNFSFKLGSTNGLLVIEKMLPDYVERIGGTIETFSASWGGGSYDTGGDGGDTITLHNSVVAVDANLSLTNEVKVYEATLTATNVVIRDNMKIVDKLLVDSETLTVDGTLNFTVRDINDSPYNTGQYFWNKSVTPRLTHLTNNGAILIGGPLNLGHDMDRGYEVIVNNGTINTYEMWLKSAYIEHSGQVYSKESIYMDAKSIYFKGGNINATNSMFITADNIKYNHHTNRVNHRLVWNIANSITDANENSEVLLEVYEGIELKQKPAFGDLLGTRVRLVSTNYIRQANYWLSDDRGVDTAGYKNNAAVGHLILKHATARFPDDSSRILFKNDTNEKHAIYVDYLEFEDYSQNDYDNKGLYFLKIDENYTIYYAASNLDEEKLDGGLDGRLKWVNQYAGLNSSVPIYIKGLDRTVKVNRGLRFSKIVDSDDDGTANGYDISPFGDGVPSILDVRLEDDESMNISIKWLLIPDSRYTIQYKEDIDEAGWKTLKEFYYSDNEIKHMEFKDRVSRKSKARYYRIKYSG